MKLEHHIPFDKDFLLEQQIAEHAFDKRETEDFRKLFEILEHYFHYDSFNFIQQIKRNYASFDPDKSHEERLKLAGKSEYNLFKNSLLQVVERSKYLQIDQAKIEEAINNSDLVSLKIHVNFDDFKEYAIYGRGLHKTTEKVPRFYFWKKEVDIEYYQRVLIFIRFHDAEYFKNKKQNIHKLPFTPGCIILKMFKRVPVNDLETIFPNAIPRMALKDKLLMWIPGLFGGVSLLSTKVIPPLIALYAAYKSGEMENTAKSKDSLTQGLVALGVLGAYLFRQYSDYLNKKLKFSKTLSDSVYFKNLGNNSGVFPALIDSSEEEELKETILAYAFLNKSNQPLTAEELDVQIESWFLSTLNVSIDFDVKGALQKLEKIGLGTQHNSRWKVLPLKEALARVDKVWDSIFDYNQGTT